MLPLYRCACSLGDWEWSVPSSLLGVSHNYMISLQRECLTALNSKEIRKLLVPAWWPSPNYFKASNAATAQDCTGGKMSMQYSLPSSTLAIVLRFYAATSIKCVVVPIPGGTGWQNSH